MENTRRRVNSLKSCPTYALHVSFENELPMNQLNLSPLQSQSNSCVSQCADRTPEAVHFVTGPTELKEVAAHRSVFPSVTKIKIYLSLYLLLLCSYYITSIIIRFLFFLNQTLL